MKKKILKKISKTRFITPTMENIPEHILLKIFKKLDKKSIVTAATVCDRWNQIISSCSNLLSRLELTFNMKIQEKLDDSINLLNLLPYKSIVIKPKFYQPFKLLNKSLSALNQHANHIEKVEFFLASSSTIKHILGSLDCTKITALTISQSYMENVYEWTCVELPNLTSLETHQASGLLKMIKVHRIESLRIVHDYDDYETCDTRINEFMQTCPKLKTLLFEHHFPVLDIDKMNFKLNDLTVSNIVERPVTLNAQQFECLKKLLAMNFETLELFLLGNFKGIDGLLEFMLPKVKKLQFLFLVCPTFNRINEIVPKNRTITDLAVTLAHSCDSNVGKTRKIIRSCTAVKKLGLNSITHDVSPLIHEAAHSMPDLKELSIFSTKGKSFNNLPKLENVESLYVERITSQTDIKPLVNLIMAVPNIKKLKIELWGGDRLAFLNKHRLQKILRNCQKLEEIFIGGLFRLPKSFVDALLETESSVRNLTIETYDTDMILENGKQLMNSKIRLTALQWQPKIKKVEEMACSDNEDYDFLTDDESEIESGPEEEIDDLIPERDEDVEVDDRFDEMGRRRSKRLRLE